MRTLFLSFAALAATFTFSSCSSGGDKSGSATTSSVYGAPVPDSLLVGSFLADLPCTDCQAYKAILNLRKGGQGGLIEARIGGNEPMNRSIRGKWQYESTSGKLTFQPDSTSFPARTFAVLNDSTIKAILENNVLSEYAFIKKYKAPNRTGATPLMTPQQTQKQLEEVRKASLRERDSLRAVSRENSSNNAKQEGEKVRRDIEKKQAEKAKK
jgi:hypothetical protein